MSGQIGERYVPIGLLGKGGMGSVYKAKDTKLGRTIALKVMNPALIVSDDERIRFMHEAQSLAMLHHPNIVNIFDFIEQDGHLCLVMELVDGVSLDRVLREGTQITVAKKLTLMSDVCYALAYAHSKRIIHRDLKPANIIMLPDGSPKLVDFGIAKILDETATRTSALIGTVDYMAPEQFQGHRATNQTDIFAAGVVLYELLTGEAPFHGKDTAQTMHNILLKPTPVLPMSLNLPKRLHHVLSVTLSKNPEERYRSATELGLILRECADEIESELKSIEGPLVHSRTKVADVEQVAQIQSVSSHADGKSFRLSTENRTEVFPAKKGGWWLGAAACMCVAIASASYAWHAERVREETIHKSEVDSEEKAAAQKAEAARQEAERAESSRRTTAHEEELREQTKESEDHKAVAQQQADRERAASETAARYREAQEATARVETAKADAAKAEAAKAEANERAETARVQAAKIAAQQEEDRRAAEQEEIHEANLANSRVRSCVATKQRSCMSDCLNNYGYGAACAAKFCAKDTNPDWQSDCEDKYKP